MQEKFDVVLNPAAHADFDYTHGLREQKIRGYVTSEVTYVEKPFCNCN